MGCNEGVCKRDDGNEVNLHWIAIGRGARTGAKVDAKKRGAKGGCKTVL